jgi:hypothetical protein
MAGAENQFKQTKSFAGSLTFQQIQSPARGIFERKGKQIKTESLCCCRHDRLGSLQGKCAANEDGVQALSNAG